MTYYRDEQEIDVLGDDADGMSEEEGAALGRNEWPQESYERDAIEAIEDNTALVVTQAQEITVTDQPGFEHAGAFLTDVLKPALAEVGEAFDDIVADAHAAHKTALAKRTKYKAPLIEAEKIVKAAMGGYITEQRRIQAEAEAERMKVAREEAEAATLAEAARLEDAGHTEAAEEMITAPVVPVVSAPPPEAPKAAGVKARMVTKYRIINAKQIKRKYLAPDEKKIRQIVNSFGADAAAMVGGIEVWEEPVIAASAR